MAGSASSGRITRWLRFRLTVSYVLFFALVFAASGLLFRGILSSLQNDQARALLDEEWAAMRGYLSLERHGTAVLPRWDFKREDPEQALIVERLRNVFFIGDADGNVVETSARYRSLGVETAEEIRAQVKANEVRYDTRRDREGRLYMIRSGVIVDAKRRFYVALGTSLDQSEAILAQFSTYYLALLPLLVAACALLGWFVSKRALTPLTELARQTEAISSSNLRTRIAPRGAGDELDDLISTFNRMVERLERSFNQTRQFSTDVSHELRTPLTVIRGQLEVALLSATTEEQYRDAMLKALDDVERLSNTVRALLHLSQAESGQLALNWTDLDGGALVSAIGEQFGVLAEAQGLTLRVDISPSAPRVRGDRVQLERLVTNLLSNAIKYTPEGGLVEVTVGGDTEWELTVRDTGRGIPADALPHIFDRFYRVPGTVTGDGLGLGLSFVAWIVQAHGGTIEVTSEFGQGSNFRVRLPSLGGPRTARMEAYGVPNQLA